MKKLCLLAIFGLLTKAINLNQKFVNLDLDEYIDEDE